MSQEQAQVSKTAAAQRAGRRRARGGNGGDPESAFWQAAAPWYQGGKAEDTPAGDEGKDDD
jgi:hypothetical protein